MGRTARADPHARQALYRAGHHGALAHCRPAALFAIGGRRALGPERLDDLINSAARDVVSSHLLIQAVRTFARELSAEALDEGGPAEEPRAVSGAAKPDTAVPPTAQDVAPEERLGRDRLTELMVKRARENLPNLGIELVDVRIKSINYVREVEQQVYKRMISERQRIAARFRSEGDGASAKIRGEKERELDRLRSEAYRQAQEISRQGRRRSGPHLRRNV